MPIPYIMAAVSGLSTLTGDIIERNAVKKAKEDAINAYTKLLIPSSDTDKRADKAGDTLYTKAMSELNSGAFAARGTLNPETLKTIAYSKMVGARAETELDIYNQDLQYNKGIQQQLAQIKSQPIPAINPLNSLEAAAGGYFAGRQLDMAEDLTKAQKAYYDRLMTDDKLIPNNTFGIGINRIPSFDVPQLSINGNNKRNYFNLFNDEYENYISSNPKKKLKNNWLNYR